MPTGNAYVSLAQAEACNDCQQIKRKYHLRFTHCQRLYSLAIGWDFFFIQLSVLDSEETFRMDSSSNLHLFHPSFIWILHLVNICVHMWLAVWNGNWWIVHPDEIFQSIEGE